MEQVFLISYEHMSKNLHMGIRLYFSGNVSKNASCISDSDNVLQQMNVQRRRTILQGISVIVLRIRTYQIDRNFHNAFDLLHCDSWGNAYDCDFL